MKFSKNILTVLKTNSSISKRIFHYTSACTITYKQGQSPKPNRREYFYFIDHQGQLFLDDARIKNFTSCFKEKQFLEFFFKRVKLNDTGNYEQDFPYISPCGRERNFIRCDDIPIVFTQLLNKSGDGRSDLLAYGGAGELLTVAFEPEKVCMLPETGRIYHPAPNKACEVGLVKSSIAIEMSKHFEFEDENEIEPPVWFTWKGTRYRLTNEVIPLLQHEQKRKQSLCDANTA